MAGTDKVAYIAGREKDDVMVCNMFVNFITPSFNVELNSAFLECGSN